MKELIVSFIGIALVVSLCVTFFSGDTNSVKSNSSTLMQNTTLQIEKITDGN